MTDLILYIDALPWWGLIFWGAALLFVYALIRCWLDNYYVSGP